MVELEFDPDKLNLTKQDLLDFCDRMVIEWKKNKRSNFRYILALEIMKAQIKITPEGLKNDLGQNNRMVLRAKL